MKLKKQKEVISDSEYIESEILLKDLYDKIEVLLKEVQRVEALTKEPKEEKINPLEVRKALTKKGVITFGMPINIACPVEVENKRFEEGLVYYDIINHRLRYRGLDGWKTV